MLASGPALVPLSGDRRGQGAIFHAGTTHVVGPNDPAAADESVDIHCTGLTAGSAIPLQIAIGGRMAAVLSVNTVAGPTGVNQVRVRVPAGITPGPAVPVRLTYLDRPSHALTMAVR